MTLDEAIIHAVHAHAGQVDKLGEPYILHPLRVMASQPMQADSWLVAAVLHDVQEDNPEYWSTMCDDVPKDVRSTVDALSKRRGESVEEYCRRLLADDYAPSVKDADIRDNVGRLFRLDDEATRTRLARKYEAYAETMTRLLAERTDPILS